MTVVVSCHLSLLSGNIISLIAKCPPNPICTTMSNVAMYLATSAGRPALVRGRRLYGGGACTGAAPVRGGGFLMFQRVLHIENIPR